MLTDTQYRQAPWLPKDWETFVFRPLGEDYDIRGYTVDALTGRMTVTIRSVTMGRDYKRIINEPLCSGCEEPVMDGPCRCMVEEAVRYSVSDAKAMMEVE